MSVRAVRLPVRASRAVLAAVVPVLMLSTASSGWAAITTQVNVAYSYQRYNNWCASASVQMILSSPAVKNNNAFVSDFLSAPDAPGRPPTQPRLQPTLINTPLGVNVSSNPQAFVYNLTHGLNTVNGVGYLNPFLPYGTGGDTTSMSTALNLLDNPGFLGAGVAQGKHAYTGWNFAPNVAGAALATRNIANSLALTQVAAQATIGSGAHSIVVNGVVTDVAPTVDGNYKVKGVIVNDPWTGFVKQQVASGFPNPGGGNGLGVNAFIPTGYDLIPNAPFINVPGVGPVRGRFKQWLKLFNAAPANPFAATWPVFATPGVMSVTATSSAINGNTVPLENGNNFGLEGTPALINVIANPNQALAQLLLKLPGNPVLAGKFPVGGPAPAPGAGPGVAGTPPAAGFNLADTLFIPDPEPLLAGDGDWMIPYFDAAAGFYTGAIAVDSITGDIDLGVFTPDNSFSYTLPDLTAIFTDYTNGIVPQSGFQVPEPGTLGLLAPGAALLTRRRRPTDA